MATILVTTTIQDAINQSVSGDIVQVPYRAEPYNEPITPKNGVDIYFEYGTELNYTGADNLPTVSDGGLPTVCKFRGVERWPEDIAKFYIRRYGEGSAVVVSNPSSVIDIFYDRGEITANAVDYPTIDVVDGTYIGVGNNCVGQNDAIRIHAGVCKIGRDVEYGGGGCWSWAGYCIHTLGGTVTQYGNNGNLSGMPVLMAEGGVTNYCGFSDVAGPPLHQTGGVVNLGAVVAAGMDPLDWCFLQNTAGGDVILKTGGEELNMTDTTMFYSAGANAYCLSSNGGPQGGPVVVITTEHLEGEIMTTQYCYASNPVQPGFVVEGIENLLSYPEINRPLEGAMLEAKVVSVKNDRVVTLNWDCPANNPNFQVLRDKKVIGKTNTQEFTDTVRGGKPTIEYTVKNVIPTLTPTKASVVVGK